MRVFILAGEPSGDKLGAALMAGLQELDPGVHFAGIGGPLMQAQGMESLFPMEELSVMGVAEVLPKYRALKARLLQTIDAVVAQKPDVLITIDSPDFSFRVAKGVKAKSDVPTVHYGAPTVWAWRPGRAAKIAHFIDHLLTLFPFEPPYFTVHGMSCAFVGHPVASEPMASPQEVDDFRARHGLGDDPVLLVLPGSRKAEVSRLASIFGKSVAPLVAERPQLRIVVPTTPAVADMVRADVATWPTPALVLGGGDISDVEAMKSEKRAAFRAAELALAASGTVSLELAAADTPMVIAYRMHWTSHMIFRLMAVTDTVTLVNLVSETRAVPEVLGEACVPRNITPALRKVAENPDAQRAAMAETMVRLGQGASPPGLRAARSVVAFLDSANS